MIFTHFSSEISLNFNEVLERKTSLNRPIIVTLVTHFYLKFRRNFKITFFHIDDLFVSS